MPEIRSTLMNPFKNLEKTSMESNQPQIAIRHIIDNRTGNELFMYPFSYLSLYTYFFI